MRKFPFPRVRSTFLPQVLTLGLLVLIGCPAFAITLTGSNGRKVNFAGIKDATPKGITVQVTAESKLIGVPWSKLDLESLETENALVYAGYKLSQQGETVEINLGTYAKEGMEHAKGDPNTPVAPTTRWKGWLDTQIGGVQYLLQMPLGKPRGILVVAQGDDGNAFRFVMGHQKGGGEWGKFQNKFQLALMSYEYGYDPLTVDPTKLEAFAFADRKTGEHILQAIDKFAIDSKNPELVDLPIAIYGSGRVGAALAYSFVNWKPERIVAAAAVKGAFYQAKPTEASAKVPLLMVWGQYSNQPEIWKSEDSAEKVFNDNRSMPMNWTFAREYRGRAGMNPTVEHFARAFLTETIEMRLPDKMPDPPKEEPEDEEKGKGKAGEKPEEEEKPEKPERPPIKEIDRSKGYIGNVASGVTAKLEDPNAVPGEDETFIPNQETAKIWKEFARGEFDPPRPKPPPAQ